MKLTAKCLNNATDEGARTDRKFKRTCTGAPKPSTTARGASGAKYLLLGMLCLELASSQLRAQELPHSRGFALNAIRIIDEDDDGVVENDEPYLITTQFQFRFRFDVSARRYLVDEGTLRVNTLMNGQNNLDRSGDGWADEDSPGHEFSSRYGTSTPLEHAGWMSGAVVVHMEEDYSPSLTVTRMGTAIRDVLIDRLRTLVITGMTGSAITEASARTLTASVAVALGTVDIAGIVDRATDSDDFGGVGLILITSGPNGRAFVFTGSPPLTSAAAQARIGENLGSGPLSLQFPSGSRRGSELFRGNNVVEGVFTDWSRTFMSDIIDAAVMPDGSATQTGTAVLVRRDGTLVATINGIDHLPITGPTSRRAIFGRVAVGPENTIWAVESNGTLWSRNAVGIWQRSAPTFPGTMDRVGGGSGVADVTVAANDGRIWVAGRNGTVWSSRNRGASFTPTRFTGFERVCAGRTGELFGVGDGTLWELDINGRDAFRAPFSAIGVANRVGGTFGLGDVAVAPDGTLWLAGKDGSIWSTKDLVHVTQVEAGGFASVAADPFDGTLWAVGAAGSLWTFDAFLPTVADLAR